MKHSKDNFQVLAQTHLMDAEDMDKVKLRSEMRKKNAKPKQKQKQNEKERRRRTTASGGVWNQDISWQSSVTEGQLDCHEIHSAYVSRAVAVAVAIAIAMDVGWLGRQSGLCVN